MPELNLCWPEKGESKTCMWFDCESRPSRDGPCKPPPRGSTPDVVRDKTVNELIPCMVKNNSCKATRMTQGSLTRATFPKHNGSDDNENNYCHFGKNHGWCEDKEFKNACQKQCTGCSSTHFKNADMECKERTKCKLWEKTTKGSATTDDTCTLKEGCDDFQKHFYNGSKCVPRKKCKAWEMKRQGDEFTDNKCKLKEGCDDLETNFYNGEACVARKTCKVWETRVKGNETSDDKCNPKAGCDNLETNFYNESACVSRKVCKAWETKVQGNETTDNTCTLKAGCNDFESNFYDGNACVARKVCKPWETTTKGNQTTDNTCTSKPNCGNINTNSWLDVKTMTCKPLTTCGTGQIPSGPVKRDGINISDRSCKCPEGRMGANCEIFRAFITDVLNSTSTAPAESMTGVTCNASQFKSEKTGTCVDKPWSDFASCQAEKIGGACVNNSWVQTHCVTTCG